MITLDKKNHRELIRNIWWLIPALLTKNKIRTRRYKVHENNTTMQGLFYQNGCLWATDGQLMKGIRISDAYCDLFVESGTYTVGKATQSATILTQEQHKLSFPNINGILELINRILEDNTQATSLIDVEAPVFYADEDGTLAFILYHIYRYGIVEYDKYKSRWYYLYRLSDLYNAFGPHSQDDIGTYRLYGRISSSPQFAVPEEGSNQYINMLFGMYAPNQILLSKLAPYNWERFFCIMSLRSQGDIFG